MPDRNALANKMLELLGIDPDIVSSVSYEADGMGDVITISIYAPFKAGDLENLRTPDVVSGKTKVKIEKIALE